jgi:hypothetical protein
MVERIAFVAVLMLLAAAVYWVFRSQHMRRLKINLATGRPTLLYFRNDGCSPCMTQSHYLEIQENQFQDKYALQKIDTELEPEKDALAARSGAAAPFARFT